MTKVICIKMKMEEYKEQYKQDIPNIIDIVFVYVFALCVIGWCVYLLYHRMYIGV